MKLKQWPVDDLSYLQAMRQLAKFLGLFDSVPRDTGTYDDYADARTLYGKLVTEVCERYELWSMEEFWHWCYVTAIKQLDAYEERLSQSGH